MSTAHLSGSRPGTPIWQRLVALAIALLLIWAFMASWGDDLRALIRGNPPELPMVRQPLPDEGIVNPALQACLDKRIGDVDSMREEGVIDDVQYAAFRDRAEALCHAQNPPDQAGP